MQENKPAFCVDCQHYRTGAVRDTGLCLAVQKWNLESGDDAYTTARMMRLIGGECGPHGKLFEAKK